MLTFIFSAKHIYMSSISSIVLYSKSRLSMCSNRSYRPSIWCFSIRRPKASQTWPQRSVQSNFSIRTSIRRCSASQWQYWVPLAVCLLWVRPCASQVYRRLRTYGGNLFTQLIVVMAACALCVGFAQKHILRTVAEMMCWLRLRSM